MPRDLDLDLDFQEDRMEQRPVRRPAPQRGEMPAPPRNYRNAKRKKNQTTSIIILAVEIVVFIALLVLFFVLKGKIADGDSSTPQATESSSEAGSTNNGVNVDSPDFTLTCTKVQLANDVNNQPVALIFFTFVNKTETPLAMTEVYPASLKQNGVDCAGNAELFEYPAEYANKDMQVSGGQSVDCCYAFSITDLTSPLTLTVHDNYSTFTDIGSTEIPLS